MQIARSRRLQSLIKRTFVGSCLTMASTVVCVSSITWFLAGVWLIYFRNLSVLMAVNGEPAWLCLICCKADSMQPQVPPALLKPAHNLDFSLITVFFIALFSTIVIHWVTSKDNIAKMLKPPNQLDTSTITSGPVLSTISNSGTDVAGESPDRILGCDACGAYIAPPSAS